MGFFETELLRLRVPFCSHNPDYGFVKNSTGEAQVKLVNNNDKASR